MIRRALLFMSLFAAWLIFAGRADPATVLAGVVVALAVTGLGRGVFFDRGPHGFDQRNPGIHSRSLGLLTRIGLAFAYLPIFLYHILRASMAVARYALSLRDRLNPGIVRFKTNLQTRTGITVLANLITLTPGTLTVDFDEESNCLYIHWIDVKTYDRGEAQMAVIRMTENWVRKIFE